MGHIIITIIKIIFNPFNLSVIIIGLLFSYYIYKESNKYKSRQLLNYLPNVWTSLGILGTFSSIVYSFESSNVDWTNVNQLVKNIVPAFETSIIGIIGAIFSSVFSKKKYAKEDDKTESDYLTTYKMMPEQHIGAIDEQMTRLLKITKEQHAELMEESKKQHSLAERMIEEFTVNLQGFYDKLYEEEKQHAGEMTERYLSSINLLIMGTDGTIKDKFETLFTEHSESLKKLMENEEKKFNQLSIDITEELKSNSQTVISSISDICSNDKSTLETITKNQKELLQSIIDDNKANLTLIVQDNKNRLANLTQESSQNLSTMANDFTALTTSLKARFEEIAAGLPESIEQLKDGIIKTIQDETGKKFETLTESHQDFVDGLLKKVEEFDEKISNKSKESQAEWIKAVNNLLNIILTQVHTDVKGHLTLMQKSSKDMNEELTSIIEALKEATTNYTSINEQIAKLVEALKKETNATEVYANLVTPTNNKLTEIQQLLTDIANKNIQLRQELAQWRRTHKQVEVDVDNGTKKCPNCNAENPIDASYCRKCATSFWECEPIIKKGQKTDN